MHGPILAPPIVLSSGPLSCGPGSYATRSPAIITNKIVCDPHRPTAEFLAQIPDANGRVKFRLIFVEDNNGINELGIRATSRTTP